MNPDKQKELSNKRNERAYAIVGWAMACVDSVQDHQKRQGLRELLERYSTAERELDQFYAEEQKACA